MEENTETYNRDSLIKEYRSYVRYVVAHLIKSMNLPVELQDEFIAAGYLGLVEAAEKFDKGGNGSFRGYAFYRIRGAIIDSLRKSSELSATAYRFARALKAAEVLKDAEFNKLSKPCVKNKDPKKRLARVLDYAAKGALVHRLSVTGSAVQEELIDHRQPDPESQLLIKQEKHKFDKLIDALPLKQQMVVREYYFAGKSFTEIAEENDDLSKSWVSRLHHKAINQLKEWYLESEKKL